MIRMILMIPGCKWPGFLAANDPDDVDDNHSLLPSLFLGVCCFLGNREDKILASNHIQEPRPQSESASSTPNPNLHAEDSGPRTLAASHQFMSFILPSAVRRYSFSLYPVRFFSHRVFSMEEVFNEICHFLYTATPHSALCHFLHVSHVGQFLFQPHALASRLRGCVRVTRTSIRDDPVDPEDIHSRDMDRGILSSCIYTWLRAQHPYRQDNRNKIDFYVSTSRDLSSRYCKILAKDWIPSQLRWFLTRIKYNCLNSPRVHPQIDTPGFLALS